MVQAESTRIGLRLLLYGENVDKRLVECGLSVGWVEFLSWQMPTESVIIWGQLSKLKSSKRVRFVLSVSNDILVGLANISSQVLSVDCTV